MPWTLRRRVLATLLLAAVPALAMVVGLPAAHAGDAVTGTPVVFLPTHARLTGTAPVDGSTVERATEVVLSFNEDVNPNFVEVAVEGPDGTEVDGDPVVDGQDVTQALAADLPAGTHEVAYRVVSTDGHPVSGTVDFTTTAAPTPTESASPTPTTTAPSGATTPSPATEPSASATASPAVDSTSTAGPSTGQWVAIGAGVLAVLVGLTVMAARRDRNASGGRSV